MLNGDAAAAKLVLRRMWVAPILPQPPAMGTKMSGCSLRSPPAARACASDCRSPAFQTLAWRRDASGAENRRAHVRAFFGAFEAQRSAAEIGGIHGCVSAKEYPI